MLHERVSIVRLVSVGMLGASLAVGTALVLASDQDAEHDAMVQAANAQPAKPHEALMSMVGSYTTVTRFWGDADKDPAQSFGTATITQSLGQRFIIENSSGQMMGQPATGVRMIGFNNGTQRYEATWGWSLSTAMARAVGTSSDAGRTIVWEASWDEGVRGGGAMTVFALQRVTDAGFTFALYGEAPKGDATDPTPVMLTTYTRTN